MFERRFFTQSKAALTRSIKVCVFVAHCDLKSDLYRNAVKLRKTINDRELISLNYFGVNILPIIVS